MTRTPPHDLVTERAVLACVLADANAIDELDQLDPSDFYGRPNHHIFTAMVALRQAEQPIDLVTLRSWLADHGELEKAGGDDALIALTDFVPSSDRVETYAARIRGLSSARMTIRAAHEIAARGYEPIEDLEAFGAEAEAIIAKAARARALGREPVSLGDAVNETIENLQRSADDATDRPLPTGLDRLDGVLAGGLRVGQLVLVAGRPGHGKTAIGLQLALSLAKIGPGVFFELEMTREELTQRAIACDGHIDGGRLRTRKLAGDDWQRIAGSAGRLASLPIVIDDDPNATLVRIRSTARRQKARAGLTWIVVDYLQLMPSADPSAPREVSIGNISRGLKALAKELSVPVLALAQLNRDLERRPVNERRPRLSDLRDSGSLEQDADVIMFVFREELYVRDDRRLRGLAELIIGKQRNGPLASLRLRYHAPFTRFEELGEDDEAELEEELSPPRRRAAGGYGRGFTHDPSDFEDL